VLVAVTLGRLFYLGNSGLPERSYRYEMWPFSGLAAAIREEGLNQGTLVVDDWRHAGNIHAALPEARVVSMGGSRGRSPEPATLQPCRLIWNDTAELWPGERWARESKRPAIDALLTAGTPLRHFDIAWGPTFLGTPRISRWSMIDLDPADPLCR
jgi:hypothetical protein